MIWLQFRFTDFSALLVRPFVFSLFCHCGLICNLILKKVVYKWGHYYLQDTASYVVCHLLHGSVSHHANYKLRRNYANDMQIVLHVDAVSCRMFYSICEPSKQPLFVTVRWRGHREAGRQNRDTDTKTDDHKGRDKHQPATTERRGRGIKMFWRPQQRARERERLEEKQSDKNVASHPSRSNLNSLGYSYMWGWNADQWVHGRILQS